MGPLVERRVRDQAAQHLLVEAECARLGAGEGGVGAALRAKEHRLERVLKLLGGDHLAADVSKLVRDEAAEHVADSPDGETGDQQPEQQRHDGAANQALRKSAHPVEHGRMNSLAFERALSGPRGEMREALI